MGLPSIELLNSTHQFPCNFTFKAIGDARADFPARIVAAVREALGLEVDPPFTTRATPNGKHVAITVEPNVRHAEDVLAVYPRIQEVPGLVMLL